MAAASSTPRPKYVRYQWVNVTTLAEQRITVKPADTNGTQETVLAPRSRGNILTRKPLFRPLVEYYWRKTPRRAGNAQDAPPAPRIVNGIVMSCATSRPK